MSHPLVVGLFDATADAASAARAAHTLGIVAGELSVVARDPVEEGALARTFDATRGAEIEDSRPAARLGELSAYLLAAVAVGVPGLGSVITAGPLSAEFGEAAGHAAGDLSAVLVRAGIDEKTAQDWEERVEQGAILLAAHARGLSPEPIVRAFLENGATAHATARWPR